MTLPEGLIYVPGFLTEAEERDVLAVLATFELHPYVLHDTPSRRLVRSFGLALVAGAYDAGPAAPVPAELGWLRERCAALMGREPGELADLLVTRYPPGAGIGWHRDAPQFGEVGGISLQAACRMRFRHGRTPRLADGRTHPRAPLRLRPVRSGADTMAAPHPPGHPGAVVDDVPDPAARRGRRPVSGRTRVTVRVHPRARSERLEWDGSDAAAVGPRAACRRAGQRSGDPRRGAVGQASRHRRWRSSRVRPHATNWSRSTTRTRSLRRLCDRHGAAPRSRQAHAGIVIREPAAAPAVRTGALVRSYGQFGR